MANWMQDIRQGDDYVLKIDFGVSNDITDFEFWLTLKESFDDTDAQAVLQYHTKAGDYLGDDPTHGIVYLMIPAVATKAAIPGLYLYDLQAKDTSGQISTIIPPVEDYKDRVRIIPEITQGVTV